MMNKSFKGDKAFLSNMYKANIQYKLNGEIYNFLSVENAYQAMKFKNKDIWRAFERINPYDAKRNGKSGNIRENWDDIKLNIMQKLVHIKFEQHPELMDKLLKCELPLKEENTWGDRYWGICNGIGKNHLGAILTAEAINEKIKRLTDKYHYKQLSIEESNKMRQLYAENIPDFFRSDNNRKEELHDIKGNLITKGWDRIVIGDYGAFVEIDDKDICKENIECKPGEEYRIYDEKYKNHVKYQWFVVKSQSFPKLYYQQKGVTYADYKPNKWYISPYECMEGLSITCINKQQQEIKLYTNEKVIKALKETSIHLKDIDYKTVIFDTETTGTYNNDEILQISIYDISGTPIYDTYIKPYNKTEWKEAESLNHISPEMVKNAPYAHEIAPIIRDIFESVDIIAGHNVAFDARMVKNNLGIIIPDEKLYDTMKIFKNQYPGRQHYKLIDAVEVYCPEIKNNFEHKAHNASMDTYVTSIIYNKQLEKIKEEENQLDIDI